jgi:hypothetical protein
VIRLTDHVVHRLRVASGVGVGLAVLGYAALTVTGELPVSPDGDILGAAIEEPLQLGLLAVVLLAWIASLRWPGVGSVVIAIAGAGLGLVASVAHPPVVAVLVAMVFAVPAVLVWLTWQHRRASHEVAFLAIGTAILLVAEGLGAAAIYDYFFGPAHPVSAVAPLPVDRVEWAWSGDLRSDGVTVVARLATGLRSGASLVVEGPRGATETARVRSDDRRLVRLRVTGLDADTEYRYVVRVGDALDRGRGRGSFRTAPAGPASFTVAAGSCARTGSSGLVYDAIRDTDPLLYLIAGDAHYGNLEDTSPGPFIDALGRVVAAPAQAALYRDTPVSYVWDDHDYGPNDADATSPSRLAARRAYRAAVPHPDLPAGRDGSIHHAFTIGRVRFVVTDTRSERTAESMLGASQEAWLLTELARAGSYGAVVWVNPTPWIAPAGAGRDDWGAYPAERRRIADAIAVAGVANLVMVSGDAHMVAIDDGTNSDFSTGGGGGFPVLHAAALDRPGSVKGGPYSEGAHPGPGQFGLLHIEDAGGDVRMVLEGRTWEGRTLVSLEVVLPAGANA